MAGVVEAWLFEYACYHRDYKVIKEICKRHADVVKISDYFNVPHIRLATAVLHHAVDTNVMELFPLALEFVDEIYELLGSVISFQVYAKLSCGIKMQILLDVLQRGQTVIALAKLNEYFPRMGIKNSFATSKELSRLNKHISSFRKFFLPLLANKKQRNYYFTNEYEEEYGEGYLQGLQKCAYKFVNKVDEQLPKPKIQKILEKGAQHFNGFSSSEVAYEILLDYCVNQTSLSCKDMLDILTSISPLYTQDIVHTEHKNTSLSSSDSSVVLIPSNNLISTPVSTENTATDGRSFTQLKDSYEKCSSVNTGSSDIREFKRKAEESVLGSGIERKQYRFKKVIDKVHHSRGHVVHQTENVTEVVLMPSRYDSKDNEDHEFYTNECDQLVHTSLEMVEKEAIEEGLLSKDDGTISSDKSDESVTNIDDIPVSSDEDNLVIQSSICPENTDSEDILLDVSKSIKDQRKYRGLNPEIKLVFDMTLSDDEDGAYKIFT